MILGWVVWSGSFAMVVSDGDIRLGGYYAMVVSDGDIGLGGLEWILCDGCERR
jgi:hypothetical protein